MENTGIVFDITRFCLHDGPGIRTTVFLKGCPLHCAWCHNPESQKGTPEILFAPERCRRCGACESVCPVCCHRLEEAHQFDRTTCIGCGRCSRACPSGALRLAGSRRTVDAVLREVRRDIAYYAESGGGLTLSGGEPMAQVDFAQALLLRAKSEGIHSCMETCGYAPSEAFQRIALLVDCFLFDWKESNPETHRCYTGVDNQLIRQNLELLNSLGADIILRLPLIPRYNDTRGHLEGAADMARRYPGIRRLEVMPYHPLGVSKARELGRPEGEGEAVIPDKEVLEKVLTVLRSRMAIPVEVCM